jgi:thioredoxin 1
MKAIEKKYGDQIRVVFHDVWTDTGSTRAEEFDIKLIPTQVFLDTKGKEFFRHEGFFPEAEIDKLLQKRGLKVRSEG